MCKVLRHRRGRVGWYQAEVALVLSTAYLHLSHTTTTPLATPTPTNHSLHPHTAALSRRTKPRWVPLLNNQAASDKTTELLVARLICIIIIIIPCPAATAPATSYLAHRLTRTPTPAHHTDKASGARNPCGLCPGRRATTRPRLPFDLPSYTTTHTPSSSPSYQSCRPEWDSCCARYVKV